MRSAKSLLVLVLAVVLFYGFAVEAKAVDVRVGAPMVNERGEVMGGGTSVFLPNLGVSVVVGGRPLIGARTNVQVIAPGVRVFTGRPGYMYRGYMYRGFLRPRARVNVFTD